jgi:hypothetical protein
MDALLWFLLDQFKHLVHHQQKELLCLYDLTHCNLESLHVLEISLGPHFLLKLVVTDLHTHCF